MKKFVSVEFDSGEMESSDDKCKTAKGKESFFKLIKNVIKTVTVEPLALFLVMPKFLSNLALNNLYLEKSCRVNLAFNETICEAMAARNRSGYTPEDEIAVQRVVSNLLPYRSFSHVFQIFIILFIGSWSDRTGNRRSMFVVPYLGDISASIGFIVCVYFFMELGVEFPMFIEAFSLATGGFSMLMAGVYSYIATITDPKSRTIRVGAASIVFRTSMTLGIASSGFMYKYLGFYGAFYSALLMNMIGFAYIFLVVKNNKPKNTHIERNKSRSCCSSLWKSVHGSITGSIAVCFKSGPNRRRTRMLLLQSANLLAFGIMTAESTLLYLFSRKQLGWNEVDFSIFKSFKTALELSGCAFVLALFSKYLQWSDIHIALLACFGRIISTIMFAFSSSGIMLYIGTLTDVFNGAILFSLRSLITKTVQQNEQALTNSLTGLLDSFGSFLMGSIYAYVYYQTVGVFPGTFFLVSLLTQIPIIIMLLITKRLVNENENLKIETPDNPSPVDT